jgi:hypothetical protein
MIEQTAIATNRMNSPRELGARAAGFGVMVAAAGAFHRRTS